MNETLEKVKISKKCFASKKKISKNVNKYIPLKSFWQKLRKKSEVRTWIIISIQKFLTKTQKNTYKRFKEQNAAHRNKRESVVAVHRQI